MPLDLDGRLLKGWDSPKASIIAARLAADFTGSGTDDGKFDVEFQKVVRALRTDERARERPPKPKL